MTGERSVARAGIFVYGERLVRSFAPIIWLTFTVGFAVFLSAEAAGYALAGIETAVLSVIPTALPSMLICDLYRSYGAPERIRPLGRLFAFVFGVSPVGLRANLLGNLCGFPMGAREVGEAYRAGALEKEEAERLIPLSSNPSPPFIVSAVGAVMLGEWRIGILLLICNTAASALAGIIFRGKRKRCKSIVKPQNAIIVSGQRYSFVESVKGAASSALIIIAFISSFSVILGFAENHLTAAPLRALIFSLVEVTGGVGYFAAQGSLSLAMRGALVAFTLGFGGISVAVQSAAFLAGSGLSMKKYLPVKLVQGLAAAVIFYVAFCSLGWG